MGKGMRRRNSNVKYNYNDKEMDDQLSESEGEGEDAYMEKRDSQKPRRLISDASIGNRSENSNLFFIKYLVLKFHKS